MQLQICYLLLLFIFQLKSHLIKVQGPTQLQLNQFHYSQIQLNYNVEAKYTSLIFEIQFQKNNQKLQFYPFALISEQQQLPNYQNLNKIIEYDQFLLLDKFYFDLAGYTTRRQTQVIATQNILQKQYYLGIYDFSIGQHKKINLTYDVYLSSGDYCPNNCSHPYSENDVVRNGTCIQNECTCFDNYIGSDCGTLIKPLTPQGADDLIKLDLPALEWTTHVLQLDQKESQLIQIVFQKISREVVLSIVYNEYSQVMEPNFYFNDVNINIYTKQYQIPADILNQYIQFTIKNQLTPKVFISFFNQQDSEGVIQFRILKINKEVLEESENQTNINNIDISMIMSLLLVSIVVVLVFYYFCCYRKIILRQNSLVVPHNVASLQQHQGNNKSKKITADNIQEYMPMIRFAEISQDFIQLKQIKECIICLDEFSFDDSLRISICSHLFHQKCIDMWINHQSECPICRQTFTINEFVNHKDNYQLQLQQLRVQQTQLFDTEDLKILNSTNNQLMLSSSRQRTSQFQTYQSSMANSFYIPREYNKIKKSNSNNFCNNEIILLSRNISGQITSRSQMNTADNIQQMQINDSPE